MIEILNKEKCCGCSACKNICPQKCIEMKYDEEGFLYPVVDKEKCINCELCQKICPILNKQKQEELEKKATYAAYNTQEKIRTESTSGGFFSSLAEEIIQLKGIVFGAILNEKFEVVHQGIENKEELYKIRGSKYVQSKIENAFVEVKEALQNNRYVLFSGTPCQIYGLKAFLQKDYEKLYCVDVICKGVPSPILWKKYKENKEKRGKISKILFREKTYGFNSTTMSIYYNNGKEYHKGHETDELLRLFVNEMCSRPSCHNCNFKGIERLSDFTIGDCWKVEKMIPDSDADKGTTLLIVHTQKGKEILQKLNNLECKAIDFEQALTLNGGNKKSMYWESAIPNQNRTEFFKDFNELEYKELIKKYCPKTLKTRIKSTLKPILYKLGILNKVKNKIK